MDIHKFKLYVNCMTYNHSAYIEDTLNGFCIQETNFPFVCVVMDDASTDGEQHVIENYLQKHFNLSDDSVVRHEETDDYVMTFACHKENRNCFFAVFYLKYNHWKAQKSKETYYAEWAEKVEYVAICEGDDYWIDPSKLQKQADFLDTNNDYVMCHTDFNLAYGGYLNHSVYCAKNDVFFPQSVYGKLYIGTLTVMYRNDIFAKLPKLWVGKGWKMGDKPLWIELSHEGKIKYLPIVTANYRILSESASHGSFDKEIAFLNTCKDIEIFYANYYELMPLPEKDKKYYCDLIKIAFKHNNVDYAQNLMKSIFRENKTSSKFWFYYFCLVFKPMGAIVKKIKNQN